MTHDHTPSHGPTGARPRLWLAIGGVLALVGMAVLWPLREVGRVCILIYPAPPGCGGPEPQLASFIGMGVVIALFAAQVAVYFTAPRPRTALILLSAAMIVAVTLAVAVVLLSQTGIWA